MNQRTINVVVATRPRLLAETEAARPGGTGSSRSASAVSQARMADRAVFDLKPVIEQNRRSSRAFLTDTPVGDGPDEVEIEIDKLLKVEIEPTEAEKPGHANDER